MIESDQKAFEYQFTEPGTYTASLTINNSEGETDTLTQTFEVLSRQPKANFTWKIESSSQPNVVFFDAIRSYDPDGEQLLFDWDFDGDGVYEEEGLSDVQVTHVYEETGKYKVKMRVHDPFDKSDTYESIVQINSVLSVDFDADTFAAVQ